MDISKKFKDTIILAVPKGLEAALEYRWIEFTQEEEPLSIAKEIKRQAILGQYFQEPIGPEPKRQGSSVSAHAIYPRDIRKKQMLSEKPIFVVKFLVSISFLNPV